MSESSFSMYNGAAWEFEDKQLYFYDASDHVIQIIDFSYNGVSFDTSGKTDNSFIGNNLIQNVYQSYDTMANTWQNEYKDTLIYNAQNKVISNENRSGWSGNTYSFS